jgi:hypothetical protein
MTFTPQSPEEEDGLEPIGKFAAQVVERLASRFFPPANDNPPPASEDAA